MRRAVDHQAMPAAGYTTPWSVRSGEDVSLHLSCEGTVEGIVVHRLDLPQPQPVAWEVRATAERPRRREFVHGSHLAIDAGELGGAGRVEALGFELFLTDNPGTRTIARIGRLRLQLHDGALRLWHGDRLVMEGEAVPARTWLHLRIGRAAGGVSLAMRSYDGLSPHRFDRMLADEIWDENPDAVLLGTDGAGDLATLNAKFAGIVVETSGGELRWTLPTRLPDGPIASSGGGAPVHLHAVNQPTFCMTSPRWDGSSFDPRFVPSHYDAVHCHDDDMGPLDWPASFHARVPDDAAPGIYAFEVRTQAGTEQVVFFVTSSRPTAPLVFLIPTATYLAYADEVLPAHLYEWKCEDRGHRFAAANGLRSLYDYHNDLSGVSICSTRKPKATLRADYLYPLCGCPHNLPVDLHLLRFCHRNGIAFDVITDHDLHRTGPAGLRGYRALVTGSHPEYMSVEMEQAIRDFCAKGGSLAYLGGNGFATTVAFRDDLMELRRSPLEAGRTWDGTVGEQALSITNEPGGFLRTRGRGEFSLTGVAISLMGFDGARPFTRTEASYDPGCAWLFAGVKDATFGHDGIVLGGAAGYEVDATDPHLGTHPDTIVIARADGFPDSFFHDPARWYAGGQAEQDRRRCAEMTIRHLPAGGLIFCASSVAWCGALPGDGDDNDVGRITRNLLERLSG